MNSHSKIIIDSNFYLALNNPQDSLHHRAVSLTDIVEDCQAMISFYIFSEIITVSSQKIGKQAAINLGLSLLNDPLVEIISIDQPIFFETWQIFTKLKPKNLSFIDCNILAMMRHHKIKKLLSFDRTDFAPLQEQFGFRLVI